MNLAEFNNVWYKSGANAGKSVLWYFINSIVFNSYLFPFYGLKVKLLKFFGAEVGNGVIIKPMVNIKYPWRLKLGNHIWIGEHVWIDNLADVSIGNNVCISQGAYLLTGNHDYKKDTFDLIIGEITIEDEVWIGAKSIVCPGVTCHKGAILAVGSVASKDLQASTIYQGNPAIEKRKRY